MLPKVSETGAVSYKTVVEEADPATGLLYKYIFKKFRDKNFPRSEVLPSYTEVINDDIETALLNLPEGTSQSIDFSALITRGRIVGLEAVSRDSSHCTFVSWNYTGSLEDLLYFVVMAAYNGVTAPVGLAIPDETKKKRELYSYCDDKLGAALGGVTYSILPIMIDGTLGQASKQVKVDVVDNYPDRALING